MLVTDDAALADRARTMRLHGIGRDAWKRYTAAGSWYYEIEAAGFKDNLTDLAAAIGLVQLERAAELRAARAAIAARYLDGLADLARDGRLVAARDRRAATSTPGTCSSSGSARRPRADETVDLDLPGVAGLPPALQLTGLAPRPRDRRPARGRHRDERPLHPAPPPPAVRADGLPARPVPGRRGGLRRGDQPADLAGDDAMPRSTA